MNDAAKTRGKIIARAWKDPEFKARLLANPKAVCKEMGLNLPDDMNVEVLEPTSDQEVLFILPEQSPPREELKHLSNADVQKHFDEWLGYGFGCCGFEYVEGIRNLKKGDRRDTTAAQQESQPVLPESEICS